MQRIKDFLSGESPTPPSLNPNHTAKDDLKHAAQDLVHAKDDLKAQAKEKAHDLGRSVRHTADDVEARAADATRDVRAEARDLRADARSTWGAARENVREGAQDLRQDARHAWGTARENVREGAQDLRQDARQAWGAARENVRDAREDLRDDLRDVRDTGRRASRDIDAKVRATGREVRNEADEIAYRARVGAHNAKVEIENDVSYAAHKVGSGLREARDLVVGSIVLVEDKIENGFDRLAAKAHHAAKRAQAEAHNAAVEVQNTVDSIENKAKQVERDVERRLSHIKFANYQAPWFRDVGYDYDVTFYQPRLVGKRVAITTPNLLGYSVRGAELTVSTVHSSVEAASNEQVASNFRWQGEFFNRPLVRVEKVNSGLRANQAWEFRRPQRVVLDAYASLPTNGGRPTVRAGATVVDRISQSVFGGSFKLSGNQWLAAYQTRLPYVSLAGAVASDSAGDKVAVSAGVASTVFSDNLRESQINVGVEVKSGKYSTKQSSTPDSLASVTAKIEYDEPSWNLDARVRARNYSEQQSQQAFKISDAHIRGLYVWNQGQYPRTALGVTVGVATGAAVDAASTDDDVAQAPGFLPYGDPDRRVASNFLGGLRGKAANSFAVGLDAPVVGVSVHHAVNPQNRVAFSLTSIRGLAASFNYRLRPDISVQTSVSTELPSWNVLDVGKTGGIGKPQLGIGLTIGAI